MDEDISKWIIDYLLRLPIDEKLTNDIMSILPLPPDDNRLKKLILLRRIEFEISKEKISDELLEYFETIEEIDHQEGKSPSELMKSAYCWVAIDLTASFLSYDVRNDVKYLEMVKKVWKDRFELMESMKSEESSIWEYRIEQAVKNVEDRERILRRDTRDEALKAIRVYLREAWGSIGPPFLQLIADKVGNLIDAGGFCGDSGGAAAAAGGVVVSNVCRDLVLGKGTQTGQMERPTTSRHVATKLKPRRGARLSNTEEAMEEQSINESHRQRNEDQPLNKSKRGREDDEGNKDEPTNKRKHGGGADEGNQHGPINIPDDPQIGKIGNETVVIENPTKFHPRTTTPEVEQVRKALKLSTMDLRASVRDPLPDALKTASTIITNATTTQPTTTVISEKNQPTRRSLMEPNETRHTMEWNDSIDNSTDPSPSRLHLDTPKEHKPSSPLKPYDGGVSKLIRRRARKVWTPLEEDKLREGVKKFGKGNWKLILNCYRDTFQDRTEVDLKDKWRNMTR